jgi:threonine dehydrogenase-like Zn-dependent dehydrogenase
MNTLLHLRTTSNEWVLAPEDVKPIEFHQVRLQVMRSLLDPTSLLGEGVPTLPVPVIGRVTESSPQGPSVGSLVLAPGDHAYECTAPAAACLTLDAQTDETSALLAGASVPALRALRRVDFEIGVHAIVLGLDLYGLLLVCVCRLAGAGVISALDARAPRRTHAERLGAQRVASPEEPGWPEALVQGSNRGGADVVFATGTDPGQVEAILRHCRKEARVLILTAVPTEPVDLYHNIHFPGRTLLGPNPVTEMGQQWAIDAARLLRLLEAGRYRPEGLLGEPVKASDVPAQRERLLGESLSVMIDWES